MIGFYNYTVYLTYFSLIVSGVGLYQAANGRPLVAIFCLMVSGLCDMFDGKIARTRHKSTEMERNFGIQLDSLADIVCFGVLPAVIGKSFFDEFVERKNILMSRPALTASHVVVCSLGCLLILCALIRLAYFNVTEEERQKNTDERRTSYIGLPVTSASLIFPLVYALTYTLARVLPDHVILYFYALVMLVVAVCFVAPFSVRKPHGKALIFLSFVGVAEIAYLICVIRFLR